MRSNRLIPAAAVAAALIVLTGCASAPPEEQAIAEFKQFVEATADGGDLNVCEGFEENLADIKPSRLDEDAEFDVQDYSEGDNPGRYDVTALVHPLEGEEEDRPSTLWVQVVDGEEPCAAMKWSSVW